MSKFLRKLAAQLCSDLNKMPELPQKRLVCICPEGPRGCNKCKARKEAIAVRVRASRSACNNPNCEREALLK